MGTGAVGKGITLFLFSIFFSSLVLADNKITFNSEADVRSEKIDILKNLTTKWSKEDLLAKAQSPGVGFDATMDLALNEWALNLEKYFAGWVASGDYELDFRMSEGEHSYIFQVSLHSLEDANEIYDRFDEFSLEIPFLFVGVKKQQTADDRGIIIRNRKAQFFEEIHKEEYQPPVLSDPKTGDQLSDGSHLFVFKQPLIKDNQYADSLALVIYDENQQDISSLAEGFYFRPLQDVTSDVVLQKSDFVFITSDSKGHLVDFKKFEAQLHENVYQQFSGNELDQLIGYQELNGQTLSLSMPVLRAESLQFKYQDDNGNITPGLYRFKAANRQFCRVRNNLVETHICFKMESDSQVVYDGQYQNQLATQIDDFNRNDYLDSLDFATTVLDARDLEYYFLEESRSRVLNVVTADFKFFNNDILELGSLFPELENFKLTNEQVKEIDNFQRIKVVLKQLENEDFRIELPADLVSALEASEENYQEVLRLAVDKQYLNIVQYLAESFSRADIGIELFKAAAELKGASLCEYIFQKWNLDLGETAMWAVKKDFVPALEFLVEKKGLVAQTAVPTTLTYRRAKVGVYVYAIYEQSPKAIDYLSYLGLDFHPEVYDCKKEESPLSIIGAIDFQKEQDFDWFMRAYQLAYPRVSCMEEFFSNAIDFQSESIFWYKGYHQYTREELDLCMDIARVQGDQYTHDACENIYYELYYEDDYWSRYDYSSWVEWD